MSVRFINADVVDGLRSLPDESVHCVVTSPPYFGLRDYGVPGQIGLEPTPAAFVGRLVDVFREVRRVLRDDGTCWLNMGDSYCSTDKWGGGRNGNVGKQSVAADGSVPSWAVRGKKQRYEGIKPKDLMLIPERLAIALQEDGWYIRARIIWAKPNLMPESVTDRPTKSHEHIWLMSKQPRYYYDADAIKEDAAGVQNGGAMHAGTKSFQTQTGGKESSQLGQAATEFRNARDVWTIATSPFAEAHFATFPPELADRCIKAGTSEQGCCAKCGAPWQRWQRMERLAPAPKSGNREPGRWNAEEHSGKLGGRTRVEAEGWEPTCKCTTRKHEAVPCTVLDPFSGAGTTCLVADRLQRHGIGIELNSEYVAMAERRLLNDRGGLLDIMETQCQT